MKAKRRTHRCCLLFSCSLALSIAGLTSRWRFCTTSWGTRRVAAQVVRSFLSFPSALHMIDCLHIGELRRKQKINGSFQNSFAGCSRARFGRGFRPGERSLTLPCTGTGDYCYLFPTRTISCATKRKQFIPKRQQPPVRHQITRSRSVVCRTIIASFGDHRFSIFRRCVHDQYIRARPFTLEQRFSSSAHCASAYSLNSNARCAAIKRRIPE